MVNAVKLPLSVVGELGEWGVGSMCSCCEANTPVYRSGYVLGVFFVWLLGGGWGGGWLRAI